MEQEYLLLEFDEHIFLNTPVRFASDIDRVPWHAYPAKFLFENDYD